MFIRYKAKSLKHKKAQTQNKSYKKKYKNQNKITKKTHKLTQLVSCSKARVKGADPYYYRTKDWMRITEI